MAPIKIAGKKKAAKLAHMGAEQIAQDIVIEDVKIQHDTSETSPYLTPSWTLLIGPQQVPYKVHRGILAKYPKLAGDSNSTPMVTKIKLPDVREDLGHILVHYLYTRTYQPLQSQVSDDKAVEFKRNVHLYGIATKYDLAGLKPTARSNIQYTDGEVTIFDILDAAKEVYQALVKYDFWLKYYLKEKMEAALATYAGLLMDQGFLGLVGKVNRFDRILMEIVGEICTEKMAIANNVQSALNAMNAMDESASDDVYTPTSSNLQSTNETWPEEPADCEEPTACEEAALEKVCCDEALYGMPAAEETCHEEPAVCEEPVKGLMLLLSKRLVV